jgi:chemotaxis protein CheY-P-specific phosphatase CheC
MDENVLAQEEIDALLQAANVPDPEREGREKEPADEVADEFFNSAKEILLALLGNDVSLEKISSGAIPLDILAQDMTEPVAATFINPDKGLNSIAVLIFDEKKMTIATDLILMGEGTKL